MLLEKSHFNLFYLDTNITLLNEIFREKQEIGIALNKENLSREQIYSIVKFYIYISEAALTDMLITSEIHDDICFIGKSGIKWDDSFYEQYKDLIDSE